MSGGMFKGYFGDSLAYCVIRYAQRKEDFIDNKQKLVTKQSY